jgi:3-methylcrotonyl-CoA carboxylase beta subunit
VSAEELGGAAVHCKISGVTDHFAANDAHALQLARTVVKNLHLAGRNVQALAALDDTPVEEPLYAADELRGLIPPNTAKPFDIRTVIARVVDGSKLDEFKPLYGSTLVTGFARLYGQPIGIVANNGILFVNHFCV